MKELNKKGIILSILVFLGFAVLITATIVLSFQVRGLSEKVTTLSMKQHLKEEKDSNYTKQWDAINKGVLDATLMTEGDGDTEFDYCLVIGGCVHEVPKTEYVRAQDHIGDIITMETSIIKSNYYGIETEDSIVTITYEEQTAE